MRPGRWIAMVDGSGCVRCLLLPGISLGLELCCVFPGMAHNTRKLSLDGSGSHRATVGPAGLCAPHFPVPPIGTRGGTEGAVG